MSDLYATACPSSGSSEEALSQIVLALGGHRSGSQWMVQCPAHDDGNPSLAIRLQNANLLVHCHAGCSQADVIAALRERGLWPNGPPIGNHPLIVATYTYTDETGHPLYEICRYEPGPNGKSKTFKQRYRDPLSGEYVWRKHPRQVLYRLPEVLEAPIIFLVEGEKDVESLRAWGFVATTNAGGVKAPWLDGYSETLRARECILVPDNDRVGWERVAKIAKSLLGSAARIRILDLPREYKDVSDWFAAGHSECELIVMLEGTHAV